MGHSPMLSHLRRQMAKKKDQKNGLILIWPISHQHR